MKRFDVTRTALATGLVALFAASLLSGGAPAVGDTGETAVPPPRPVAHWAFDEGTGSIAADSSGNGRTGTLTGAGAGWAPGQVGAHSLAVTPDSYLDAPGDVLDTTRNFSASAWVKLNSVNGYQTVVSVDGGNLSGFYLQLRADTSTFAFTVPGQDATSAPAAVAAASSSPQTGVWYHLVGVDDIAGGQASLYVNGVLQARTPLRGSWAAHGHTAIGRGFYNRGQVDWVSGQIDDAALYQRALTDQQVAALDQRAHWTFDEGTGRTATDSSGNQRNAMLGSGASWAPGHVGAHSVRLDGTASGTVEAAAPVVDTTGSFAVSAWIKPEAVNKEQTVAGIDGRTVSELALRIEPGGGVTLAHPAADASSAPVATASGGSVGANGTWYQLVGVQDVAADQLRLYVNGTLAGTAALGGAWPATGHTAIGRGLAGSPNDFFRGQVDDVIFANHPLDDAEVTQLHTGGAVDLTVDGTHPGPAISPNLFGTFLEDISHSAEGGLYGELIQNRSMMAATTPENWWVVADGSATADIATDPSHPLNSALTRSLALHIGNAGPGARAGFANNGFWGIPVTPATSYTASFFAESPGGFAGPFTVDIEGSDGRIYASAVLPRIGASWQQYTMRLTTSASAPRTSAARFVVSTNVPAAAGATVWFDQVSLFPPTYRNRPNGLRVDLMRRLAALHPAFFRVPGGNYLEGQTVATRFNWKNAIGPTWQRPGHQDDAWGYWSTDGMGLLEYLTMAEDLGAQPVLAIWAGYTLNGTVVPPDQLGQYVQDAVDEVRYATAPVSTPWGAKRAADGHPAPFHISYVEIGNEDQFDRTGSYPQRYTAFYDALHQAYPDLGFIATTTETARPYDLIDDHYYQPPAWFEANSHRYDGRSRSGPGVFVGEYASQEGVPTPDLASALGDASWLAGLERDSDVVHMVSYAPLLVNVNDVTWPTNMIGFDAATSYDSPTYYAQQLLAGRHGNVVLPTATTGGGQLQTLASRDQATGTVYLTVINPGPSATAATVHLAGLGAIRSTGTLTTLAGRNPTDTNTITDPRHIVPATSTLGGLGATFDHSYPAYSMTVLTIAAH